MLGHTRILQRDHLALARTARNGSSVSANIHLGSMPTRSCHRSSICLGSTRLEGALLFPAARQRQICRAQQGGGTDEAHPSSFTVKLESRAPTSLSVVSNLCRGVPRARVCVHLSSLITRCVRHAAQTPEHSRA